MAENREMPAGETTPGPGGAGRMVDALVRGRWSGALAGAAFGGLALIGGLAWRALRGEDAPETPPFDQVNEDEARLMLRAMVAATVADGMVDAQERARLDAAVAAAGLDRDGRAWLEAELADPLDVDALADRVNDPDAAVRIYAAARLAIDADTLQERQFLRMLAKALDVPEAAAGRLDRAVTA